MTKKSVDDDYLDAVLKLRHAAFALAGSANSLNVSDREMSEPHLKNGSTLHGNPRTEIFEQHERVILWTGVYY